MLQSRQEFEFWRFFIKFRILQMFPFILYWHNLFLTNTRNNHAITHPEGYHSADSPHAYPLLIKQLLNRAKAVSGNQQIIYADKLSYRYSDFSKLVAYNQHLKT